MNFRINTLGSGSSKKSSCRECHNLVTEKTTVEAKSNQRSKKEPTYGKVLIPGLNLDVQEKAPYDKNLTPFTTGQGATFQYGDSSLVSVSTDDPDWAPGECQNLNRYEGMFKPKITVQGQKDPERTYAAKTRKLLARKKGEAIKRRKEKHEKTERLKFIPARKDSTIKYHFMKTETNKSVINDLAFESSRQMS